MDSWSAVLNESSSSMRTLLASARTSKAVGIPRSLPGPCACSSLIEPEGGEGAGRTRDSFLYAGSPTAAETPPVRPSSEVGGEHHPVRFGAPTIDHRDDGDREPDGCADVPGAGCSTRRRRAALGGRSHLEGSPTRRAVAAIRASR